MMTGAPGPVGKALVEQLSLAECPALTTRRARRAEQTGASHDPIVWERAAGSNVVDADGNRYVDLSAGFGAAAVGHNHPRVVAAVQAQSAQLMHALGDLHPSTTKVRLLSRLAALAPFADARVILGLHGADAVEAALKTAMLHTGKPGVLAFEGGYHGLSHGPLALCGYSAAFREPFSSQLNPHVIFGPYPHTDAELGDAMAQVRQVLVSSGEPVGAVVVEPVQGRGGVHVPPKGFLAALRDLCDEQGMVLIVDEIQTGLGRTGEMYLSVAQGCEPDVICLGKALGGGLPTSACIGKAEVMAAWGTPDKEALHTATFLGNPLLSAAALSALDVIEEERLADRARQTGSKLRALVDKALRGQPGYVGLRGMALMTGVALDRPGLGLNLMQALLERGYITTPAGAAADVLSLTPALNIDPALLPGFATALRESLAQVV